MNIIALIASYLAAAIQMATPLAFAGLGESVSEKAGVLNIGIEGIMLTGAFSSFITTYKTGSLFLGILAGMLGGLVISMLHAVLSIKCKANQTIVGLALNFVALGITSFLFLLAFGQSAKLPSVKTISKIKIPVLSRIPIIGQAFFNQNILVYILFILVAVMFIIFYRTEWGINLEAVGEHPIAADTAGLNVFKIRYLTCILNGVLGGLGGTYMTLGQFGFFMENITAGRGYIALAIVTLGRRNPVLVFLSSLIMGFATALQYSLQTMGIPIPTQVFTMFPYVVAVLVLLFSIGKNSDPAALGIPYERNER